MTELCSAQCQASVSALQGSRASTARRFATRTSSVSGAPTPATVTPSTARDVTTSRASVSVARAGEVSELSTAGQARRGRPTNTLFAGVKCNSICSVGRYGEGCNSLCYCDNGSCDPRTGQCLCTRGFTGPKCDIPCSPGFYGVNCRQACPPCNSSKFYLLPMPACLCAKWLVCNVLMAVCIILQNTKIIKVFVSD